MADAIEQARRYLAKVPGAVSGNGGHDDTFNVASILVNGFALSIDQARPLIMEWNTLCQPPWSVGEIEHKLRDAAAKGTLKTDKGEQPRGCMLQRGIRSRFTGTADHRITPNPQQIAGSTTQLPIAQPAKVKGKRYNLTGFEDLPKPIADGTRALLKAAFLPGEGVGIARGRFNEDDGREMPEHGGVVLPLEKWLEKLDKADGDPNRFLSTSEKNGIYIRINPTNGDRDSDVTAYRHALIEFDHLTHEEQWELIRLSDIPCTAVLSSGGRSLHAWVRVDARDAQEYAQRVAMLYSHFHEEHRPDEKNKNPGRFSRLANCVRGSSRQELLSLKCGADSWEEWVSAQDDSGLPEIKDGAEFAAEVEPDPPELIMGLLTQGARMVLAGPSKSYKTYTLLELGLAVSAGGNWMGRATVPGRVLYINFELRNFSFRKRLKSVAAAKGIKIDGHSFRYWGLRGHSTSIDEIVPKLIKGMRKEKFDLIIIDPIYKCLGDRDENSAGDMNDMMKHLERLSQHTGAAVVFGAHYSKGNQAQKFSIDRVSGSGVFARDPDAIVTMTQHSVEGCFTVEYTLRDLPPVAPIVVRREHPLFIVDEQLDPTRLKEAHKGKPEPKELDEEGLKQCVPLSGSITKEKLICKMQKAAKAQGTRLGVNRADALIREWLADDFLHKWSIPRDGKKPGVELSREPQNDDLEAF